MNNDSRQSFESTVGTRRNILTINVEDYFQVGTFSGLIPYEHWERFEARLEHNVAATLQLLEETRTFATFFVCGWIAEKHGELLKRISSAGHEIGCHGYYQQGIRDIPPEAFRSDVRRSKQIIEERVGRHVHGFRIGRGRIGPTDLWALDILAEEGFDYDASFSPIGRQFSNETSRHRLHRHQTNSKSLWEIPVSATQILGWAIPFSGGNYLRQMPEWLIREAVARWVEKREAPLVMYFHTWELDPSQPKIDAANSIQRLRHYRNLARMEKRIRYYLDYYPFTSVSDYLGLSRKTIRAKRPDPQQTTPNSEIVEHSEIGDVTPVTIIVPCFNEEASLDYLLRTLTEFEHASRNQFALNTILIDDGSTDGTWQTLTDLFGNRKKHKIVRHSENQGIAAAIMTGFANAETECIAVIDADCTFDPMQLIDMVPLLTDDVSVVASSPLHPDGKAANVPGWRLWLSKGAAWLYRRVFDHKFSSYTSCFRVYRLSAVQTLTINNNGFCGVTEILARLDLSGHKMVEHPAILETRLLGQSKINLLRTIADHLWLVCRIAMAKWLNIPLPEPHSPRS